MLGITKQIKGFDESFLTQYRSELNMTYTGGLNDAPAFPGAEGAAAIATGGTGGTVLTVTNLNDSGPGSFREACMASGPRIIRFAVAGEISASSDIVVENGDLTIEGHTAPAGGVSFPMVFMVDASNVIIRFMNFRLRSGRDVDAFQIKGNGHTIMIDHCSLTWGKDETIGIFETLDGKNGMHDITFSWCIIADGVASKDRMGMLCGSRDLPERVYNIDFHHCLITNMTHRMPEFKISAGRFINNIVYHWKNRASTPSGGGTFDFIGNHYIAGHTPTPDTYRPIQLRSYDYMLENPDNYGDPPRPEFGIPGDASLYVRGNKFKTNDNDPSGSPTETNPDSPEDNWTYLTACMGDDAWPSPLPDKYKADSPQPPYQYPITEYHVDELWDVVLNNVGRSLRFDGTNWISDRDQYDTDIVNAVINDTGEFLNETPD